MSMGFRIGGSYLSPKKPKAWQLNLFAIFVFLPIALTFAACGWCLVFARAMSRPVRCTSCEGRGTSNNQPEGCSDCNGTGQDRSK